MRNKEKTLICVAIAGLLFMPAVIFDIRLLVIIRASSTGSHSQLAG